MMTNDNQKTIHVTKISNKKLDNIQPVRIINFDMPFSSMVKFMIKWALASVPAFILLLTIWIIISLIFILIFGTIIFTSFSQY